VFSTEPFKPQLSRISPAAGLARLFSRQALANFAKGFAKLGVVGAVVASLLWPQRHLLGGLVTTDPAVLLPFTRTLAMKMLGTVVAILAIVATADYLFQYRQWFERHKMSLREMKGGVPPDRGRSGRQRQAPAIAPDANAQAHHGGGAEGLGRHHQPNAFRHRAEI
jgi:flagellar biosynthetic protein FlhB